ncbi:MAG: glycosyltransferase [Streptomycetaceae bacterium]|nr:glycosyltransferase [Streptomycetaceae bacterium]
MRPVTPVTPATPGVAPATIVEAPGHSPLRDLEGRGSIGYSSATTNNLRVLSVFEGFFTGGARILHSDVLIGLREGGQPHEVLSIYGEMYREGTLQKMENDACYQSLTRASIPVTPLRHSAPEIPEGYTGGSAPEELAAAARLTANADVILSLKEQPLGLLNQPGLPFRPIVVCLHRSDPENQGSALQDLKDAVANGRLAAAICCAEATKAAYHAAGIPSDLLHVIPNGVNLERFRSDPVRRAGIRESLSIPADAKVVVFAARYAPMKNVPLFLQAAESFLRREPRGHIVMCGAGMDLSNPGLRQDIEAAFKGETWPVDRMSSLGVRRDMEHLYAAGDVVALTSSSGEAAPLCLIEGMMCGAVPVATDIGDSRLIVNGLGIITPPDPEAIASAWIEAANRRDELAQALADSRERFSRTRMIAAYAELLDRVHREAGRSSLPEPEPDSLVDAAVHFDRAGVLELVPSSSLYEEGAGRARSLGRTHPYRD